MRNIQHPTFHVQDPGRGHSRPTWVLNVARSFLISAIRIYQLTLSPLLSFLCGSTSGCRYTPTCSVYAVDALREHGAFTGSALAAKRICRCHPWGGCGHDPVPPKASKKNQNRRAPECI